MTIEDLDHQAVVAHADLDLRSAEMGIKLRGADVERAQARLGAARAQAASAAAIREFLDRHRGLPLTGLIEAAEAECAGAEAEVQAASDRIAAAELAAAETREHLRDLEGTVRVLTAKLA